MSTAEILANREYKYGWVTDIESETIPRGLSEDTVRLISAKKNEPEWMLEFRLKAYRNWLKMEEPRRWPNISFPEVDYQDMIYYSAPKQKATKASLDEVDPELLRTFEKLGIPLSEQKQLAGVAVDAVFDSLRQDSAFLALTSGADGKSSVGSNWGRSGGQDAKDALVSSSGGTD